jgi:hypothetical protein
MDSALTIHRSEVSENHSEVTWYDHEGGKNSIIACDDAQILAASVLATRARVPVQNTYDFPTKEDVPGCDEERENCSG